MINLLWLCVIIEFAISSISCFLAVEANYRAERYLDIIDDLVDQNEALEPPF